MQEKNLYHVLGVPYDAALSTIEVAYRQLALLYHPDRNHSADAASTMADINHAYAVLRNTEQRKNYDRFHVFRPVPAPAARTTPIKPIINQKDWIPKAETQPHDELTLLIIELHHHPYAILLDTIVSVLPSKTIHWVEDKPDWITGVIEHQGTYFPSADLRDLLDLSLPESVSAEPFLLCRLHGLEIALQIDKAIKMDHLSKTEIKAVPNMNADLTFSFLNGLFLDGDQVILYLNLEGLFMTSQWEELSEFMTTLARN
jgi:chemotaxis signal transduction protein